MAPAIVNDGNVVKMAPDSNGQTKSESAVLYRSLNYEPIQIVRGSGCYLYTNDGRAILDATGGAAVSCLGHGNETVKKAINKQMDEVSYCNSLFFGTSAGEALGRELIDGTEGKMAKAFIINSGSEAMEAALKMARQYFLELDPPQPQRVKFIARKESYHGTTLGALSVGGHVARRALFEPILHTNSSHVSACNAYRGMKPGESNEDYVARLAQELDDEFTRQGPDTVCAFIAEPVVGAALGCVPPIPGYFPAIRAICTKHSALLILDEIMSGMGRCGTLHAWQHPSIGFAPDLQTIGKGLGGGYAPVAGLLASHKVIDVLAKGTGAFSHGHTYQGHPASCAAAAAVQRVIREEGLVGNVERMGERLERGLRERLGGHRYVGNIRGRGLFWGIEFVRDRVTKEPFEPEEGVAWGVHELGIGGEFGISLYPGTGSVDGKRGDHVLLSPPYIVDEEMVDRIVALTADVVETYFERKDEGEKGGNRVKSNGW